MATKNKTNFLVCVGLPYPEKAPAEGESIYSSFGLGQKCLQYDHDITWKLPEELASSYVPLKLV